MTKTTRLTCTRCCGTGKVGNFSHVKSGVCFACGGTGTKRATKLVNVEERYGVVVYACGTRGGEMSPSAAELTAERHGDGARVEIITKVRRKRVPVN